MAAMLGSSSATPALETPIIVARRPARRGRRRTAPLPVNVTRWYQRDVEVAQHMASQGDLMRAGQLYRALRRDGVAQGLLGTRTGGLVRLPKRFTGDPDAVAIFAGREGQPGIFNAVFPASELALLDADGVVLGVGVAEFVDVEASPYPVLCRLDPEYLRYQWWEDRWYYQALDGLL